MLLAGFVYVFPRSRVLVFRLPESAVNGLRHASLRNVKAEDTYKVRVRLESPDALPEAISLARQAYEAALDAPERQARVALTERRAKLYEAHGAPPAKKPRGFWKDAETVRVLNDATLDDAAAAHRLGVFPEDVAWRRKKYGYVPNEAQRAASG